MIKSKIVKVIEEKNGQRFVGIPATFNPLVPASLYFCVSEKNGCILLTPTKMPGDD